LPAKTHLGLGEPEKRIDPEKNKKKGVRKNEIRLPLQGNREETDDKVRKGRIKPKNKYQC